MTSDCPIRIECITKKALQALSLTYDINNRPTESYDSIIRRAITTLNAKQNQTKIDLRKIT